MLFMGSEMIKHIFCVSDSIDPLNMGPFKNMLIWVGYIIRGDMVYLLVRLLYGLRSLPCMLMIFHFIANDFLQTVTPPTSSRSSSSSKVQTTSTTTLNSNNNINKNTPLLNNNIINKPASSTNITSSSSSSKTAVVVTTTVTTTASFLPISLSPSKAIELLNPLLLYTFCRTTLQHGLSNLSLLFLIFLLANLIIGSELRMVLQGERCWLLGRSTVTIMVTEGTSGDEQVLVNKIQKMSSHYDKWQSLRTMVMCGCVCLMLQNLLLVFESVQ